MERIWEPMSDPNAKKNVPLYDETLPKGVSFDQLRIITGRVCGKAHPHPVRSGFLSFSNAAHRVWKNWVWM